MLLHASGMRAQIGDQSQLSVALLDCHICSLDQQLNRAYLECTNHHEQCILALAGFTDLLLWLGWLCSSEVFGLTWADLMVLEPKNSNVMDLPTGCGMISGCLAPETKSAWSFCHDVPMAYKTLLGLHLGKSMPERLVGLELTTVTPTPLFFPPQRHSLDIQVFPPPFPVCLSPPATHGW
jgi:hypothetical protein